MAWLCHGLDNQELVFLFPTGQEAFRFFKESRVPQELIMPPHPWAPGWSGWGLNLPIYLHVVPQERMDGAPACTFVTCNATPLLCFCLNSKGPLRADGYVRLAFLQARSKLAVGICHRISWFCLKKLKTAHRDSSCEALLRLNKLCYSFASSEGHRSLQSEQGTCEDLTTACLPDNTTSAVNISKFTAVIRAGSSLLQVLTANLLHLTFSGIQLKISLRACMITRKQVWKPGRDYKKWTQLTTRGCLLTAAHIISSVKSKLSLCILWRYTGVVV